MPAWIGEPDASTHSTPVDTCVDAVQRGLDSEANEVLTLGLFEGVLGHLHRELHQHLAGAGRSVSVRRPGLVSAAV